MKEDSPQLLRIKGKVYIQIAKMSSWGLIRWENVIYAEVKRKV
jgi:hypothetical protein